jgi:uncharacterized protein (TIGR02145 family)
MERLCGLLKIKNVNIKSLLLIISLFFGGIIAAQNSDYNSFSDKEIIYSDDFTSDKGLNVFGTSSIGKYNYRYYALSSTSSSNLGILSLNKTIDQTKDFQIEATMKFVSGEDNNGNGITWGRKDSDNRYWFHFTGSGYFSIGKKKYGTSTNLKEWSLHSSINKTDYNKLTIRKVGNNNYFFINESLVYQCEFESFYGDENYLYSNINSTINISKIEFSYLKTQNKKIELMSQDQYVSYMYDEVRKKYTNAQLSPSGLVYVIENMGEGDKPVLGSKIGLHYKGTIRSDGKKFDSSYDRNSPLEFNYLVQKMIPGFEEGIGMLGKGGKATLIIPYFQAYGKEGRPGEIPPYSDLVFEIEILQVDPANSSPQQGVKINNPNKSSNTYSSNTNNNETKNLPLKLSQTWTKENARIATDIDGIDLILAEDIDQWKSLCDKDQAAYCYYKFDSDNENMGFIYNHAAVRIIAPEGYRVPSKKDFELLLTDLKSSKRTSSLCRIVKTENCSICFNCKSDDYDGLTDFKLKPFGWLCITKSNNQIWKENKEDMYLWTLEKSRNSSMLSGLGLAQFKMPSTIRTVELKEINNVGSKSENVDRDNYEFIEKYYGTFLRFIKN